VIHSETKLARADGSSGKASLLLTPPDKLPWLVLVVSKMGAGGTVLEGSEHEVREVKIPGVLRKAGIHTH
jgi:hypothetical protein